MAKKILYFVLAVAVIIFSFSYNFVSFAGNQDADDAAFVAPQNPIQEDNIGDTISNQGASEGNDVIVTARPMKISQVIGDFDKESGTPTINKTYTRFGVNGTDLGVPFNNNGKIYVLFGDTNGKRPKCSHPIAYVTDMNPENGLKIDFIHNADGIFRPIEIPGITTDEGFEVPVEGVSANGKMYIYHTADKIDGKSVTMGRTFLAVSNDNGYNFKYVCDVSKKYFINVSISKVDPKQWPGLPECLGEGLMIFGSGPYRRSEVRLAFQPVSQIESPKAMRYFAGLNPDGSPKWSKSEEDAQPLFKMTPPCIGEVSVKYNRFIRKWIMLFNRPGGIAMRTADKPWGPWSGGQVIFNPWKDKGYCHFIHSSWKFRKCDNLSGPKQEDNWGGSYGPYQFEDFATGDASSTTIYFTMSTWIPYTVVWMKATLQKKPAQAGPIIQKKMGSGLEPKL